MADACSEEVAASRKDEEALRPWLEVPRGDKSPFVHRFRTKKRKYVYDVNTRRIIRVSDAVWDVIEDYGRMDDRRLITKRSSVHPAEAVVSAIKHIAQARDQQGLFLSFRPAEVLPPKEEMVRKRLADYREQLVLNVTEDCNFRCSYCVFGGKYPHFRVHSPRRMTWDVAKAALDEFVARSRLSEGRVVSFYGGEPLLNFALIRQCVLYLKARHAESQVRFGLTTNGYLLKGEPADFMAAEGFLVIVSLDGPAAVHDRHRRTRNGRPTWAKLVANLRDFLAAHPEYRTNGRLRFNAVAGRGTDLREVQSFFGACELFTDGMGLEITGQKQAPDEPASIPLDSPLFASRIAVMEEFIQGLKSGRLGEEHDRRSRWVQTSTFEKAFLIFHKRGYLSPHLPERLPLLNTCIPGARRTFVNSRGDYFACERVAESGEGIIGDFKQGVDLPKVMTLLQRWADASQGQCRYCWCLPTCSVGCFATVGDDGRVTAECKRRACAICRCNTHQLLAEYCGILEANPAAFDYTARIDLH